MKTRKHNKYRAKLAELARFAYRRGEAYRKLRDEQRQDRQADLAKEKEEARKAREPRETRRIRNDKEVAVMGASQGSPSSSQAGKTLSGTENRCWSCNADGRWAYDCPELSKCNQHLVKNASKKSAMS